jgi:hypothetical protein
VDLLLVMGGALALVIVGGALALVILVLGAVGAWRG